MSNIEHNLRAICRHEAKPNPRSIPFSTLTRGFEAVAYPKIVRELRDEDLGVKQKALIAARELLGSPPSYVQCITAGITPSVIALLKVCLNMLLDMRMQSIKFVVSFWNTVKYTKQLPVCLRYP